MVLRKDQQGSLTKARTGTLPSAKGMPILNRKQNNFPQPQQSKTSFVVPSCACAHILKEQNISEVPEMFWESAASTAWYKHQILNINKYR